MFNKQSFTKDKVTCDKWINGTIILMDISQPRFTTAKIHSLRDAAFGVDCLTPLRTLKIVTVGLKMDSRNAIKNCYML